MTAHNPQPKYRFVPEPEYVRWAEAPIMHGLRRQGYADIGQQRQLGAERLAQILEYALDRVPSYRSLSGHSSMRLDEFPVIDKQELGQAKQHLARGAEPLRWNRTSGSTSIPTRSALGSDHELNQIVRWLRHWRDFGATTQQHLLFIVPRAYRLRLIGGGRLRDLAGGYLVDQMHPGEEGPVRADLVVANPHLLEQIFPSGWQGLPRALVTSYEQRPVSLKAWPALTYADVYGLSEVGDIAWQRVGDSSWHIHHDLVRLEIATLIAHSPLVAGELVVTDLTNTVMPLIRYRTGDLAIATCRDGEVEVLYHIIGRRIATRGTALEGLDLFSTLMMPLLDAGLPFRVTSSGPRTTVWICTGGCGIRQALRARLTRHLPGVEVCEYSSAADTLRPVLMMPCLDELRASLHEVGRSYGGGRETRDD